MEKENLFHLLEQARRVGENEPKGKKNSEYGASQD